MLLIIEEEYELHNTNMKATQTNNCDELINNEQNVNKKISIVLPKYISIRKHETEVNKYYLIYDKKSGSKRNTLKALCSNSKLLNTNLELFIRKIEEKFAT